MLFLKRKVLSLFLQSDTEELFKMSESKVFQSVGAAIGVRAPSDLGGGGGP